MTTDASMDVCSSWLAHAGSFRSGNRRRIGGSRRARGCPRQRPRRRARERARCGALGALGCLSGTDNPFYARLEHRGYLAPEPICSGQQNHQSARWRQPSPRVPHAGLFLDGLKDLSAGPYAGASFIAAGHAWKTGLFRCWGRYSSNQSQFSSMTFAGGTMRPLIRAGEATALTIDRIVALRYELSARGVRA